MTVRYRNGQRCIRCKEPLTRHQMMYSQGRCPLCGHKEPHSGTVVTCEDYAIEVDASAEHRVNAVVGALIVLLPAWFLGWLMGRGCE